MNVNTTGHTLKTDVEDQMTLIVKIYLAAMG